MSMLLQAYSMCVCVCVCVCVRVCVRACIRACVRVYVSVVFVCINGHLHLRHIRSWYSLLSCHVTNLLFVLRQKNTIVSGLRACHFKTSVSMAFLNK